MKKIIFFSLFSIFVVCSFALAEHRERGTLRWGSDSCEYEIYFKDGYLINQDAHIRINLRAPLRAVQPVLEIRFTSTKGDSVHTICDLTEANRCLKEVWSSGVPYRGELRGYSGEHYFYPENLGKLGHFNDKYASTYRDQDWERGFIEVISGSDRVLARVPYFVRRQGDRGFIAFGQAALREQRLHEQQVQTASPPPSQPISPYPPPPQTSVPEKPAEIDLSEFEFGYDFIYEYSLNSSVYPPVIELTIKAREKIRYRPLWQPYGKDYLTLSTPFFAVWGESKGDPFGPFTRNHQECKSKYKQSAEEKCALNNEKDPKSRITLKKLKVEDCYSIFKTNLLLESPITKYLVVEKGFKYSPEEPKECSEKIKIKVSVNYGPVELVKWFDNLHDRGAIAPTLKGSL
ncbi:MAG: hypothetical protein QW404_03130, partial [Candidatus Nanoarchaeia archaeon]